MLYFCKTQYSLFIIILAVSGSVEHGNHYTITLMYEHRLDRTASSMTHGPFGNIAGMSLKILSFHQCRDKGLI